MTDREKVIKGLERCMLSYKDGCDECPYIGKGMCQELLGENAIALLKAKEPVEPTEPDEDNMVCCGACGSPVGYEVLEPSGMDYVRYNYCPNCGRAVKWE